MSWLQDRRSQGLVVAEHRHKHGTAFIVKHPSFGHYCGYVEFDEGFCDFALMRKYHLTDAINVHGGITFDNGNTLGFDCGHSGDDRNPDTKDILWLFKQTSRIYRAGVKMSETAHVLSFADGLIEIARDAVNEASE